MTAAATPLPVPRRRGLLIRLVVATIVGLLLFGVSIPFALTSFMVFDAGETTLAWIEFTVAWLVPLVLILGLIVAWISFAARATVGVYIGIGLAALPLLAIVALIVALAAGI